MTDYYQALVSDLEKVFGSFDEDTKRFVNANNSTISRKLGYSDAQFSRLINGTATEGEYQRANQNVKRILTIRKLEAQLQKASGSKSNTSSYFMISVLIIIGLVAIAALVFLISSSDKDETGLIIPPRNHTLQWAFESSFISPYIKLDDLPGDCNYPCYKYQGKWKLEKNYKLPFFREQNGFHYLATEVEMYSRCMVEKSDNGDILEGYEYQKHEIWYDTEERTIDSFMIANNTPSDSYQNMDFDEDPAFVKVAYIHTFFRNEFVLGDSIIQRSGKVIGRDFEPVEKEVLSLSINDETTLDDIYLQLNQIISNRLEDFSRPISCSDALLISTDLSEIEDGDKMSFQCALTTGGFPIRYVKTYTLTDQYIKNDCVPRGDDNLLEESATTTPGNN